MKPMHPRKRLQKIINETSQMIRDATYWNQINPQHQPMDVEPERVMLRMATRAAELWDQGQIAEWDRATNEMMKYAATLEKEE